MVLGDPAEVGPEPGLGLRAPVGGVRRRRHDRRQHPRPDLVEEGAVHVPLGVEVLVEHRFRHAGGLGDVVHRRLVVAGAGEDVEGDVEQLLAAGGGGESRGHGYPMVTGGVTAHAHGRRVRPP